MTDLIRLLIISDEADLWVFELYELNDDVNKVQRFQQHCDSYLMRLMFRPLRFAPGKSRLMYFYEKILLIRNIFKGFEFPFKVLQQLGKNYIFI